MRRLILIAGAGLALVLAAVWALGGLAALEAWAAAGQRQFQNAMAGSLRALRAGEAGALAALLGVAFAYGFFHAVGPGHGKFLIGGYGLARRVRLWPLAGIAVAASLAQATTAVALVYAGVFLFDWSRERMEAVSGDIMAPVSYAAIALIGLWLAVRGVRGLRRAAGAAGQGRHDHAHHHHHGPGDICGDCGHRHGPSPEEVARLTGWRDAALLIGGIALRPCTGALFLLVLTWRMGVGPAGIAGTYAMGLGAACVTLAVAAMSVWAREGAFAAWPALIRARAALPAVELAIGLAVAMVAGQLMLRAI